MKIELYQTVSGRNPVLDYILGLPLNDRALVDAVLEDLEIYGLGAPLVSMRHIDGKL